MIPEDQASVTGRAHICGSDWVPGEPVWNGTIDGGRFVVQLRPILNGYTLAHGGFAADARVYTRREADLAALMPEKKAFADVCEGETSRWM